MAVYDAGLKIDPNNAELLEGKQKTMYAINSSMHEKGDQDQINRA